MLVLMPRLCLTEFSCSESSWSRLITLVAHTHGLLSMGDDKLGNMVTKYEPTISYSSQHVGFYLVLTKVSVESKFPISTLL